ncbi:hypothetical protein CRYUN_Cryun19dG0038900 [Craigia yunnanensis]
MIKNIAAMAVRLLLALGCLAEEASLLARGGNRRLVQEIGIRNPNAILWRFVQAKMQSALKAKQMQQGVWDLLLEVQVRATRDFREQGSLRDLVHWHDHPWKRHQVPLISLMHLTIVARYWLLWAKNVMQL